jgi:hypothetical protein
MILDIITSGINIVLCTSKGVLIDLNKRILIPQNGFIVDDSKTSEFVSTFISDLKGTTVNIKMPIGIVYKYKKRLIYAIAIPSPGSPQRQVHTFGWKSGSKSDFAYAYLKNAFTFLKNLN